MADRITTSMVYGSMMGSLQNNLQNLLDLQRQAATQNKYSKLSDNPADIARALGLESSIVMNEQYIRNQDDGVTMLKYAETALDTAVNILQTIRTKVIYAGDGALDKTAVAAIADEIDALKQQLLDTLNTKVAGKYIFGGTDTTTKPFVMDESGRIRYVGSDERIRYQIEEGLLGDVSFTGSDVMAESYKSYFVCSHYVPLDWQWTGREEKVQITVGDRTLAIYIPEQWIDEVSTGSTKPTDYNEFRDPDELTGISLDDVATLVNRALKEQGVDMLVTATVEKNYDSNQQRLVFKSNTGEPISITGWPDTDYMPMPQSVAGLTMGRDANDDIIPKDWNDSMLAGNQEVSFSGLRNKVLSVYVGGTPVTIDFASSVPPNPDNMEDLLAALNGALNSENVVASEQGGKIILTSSDGEVLRVDGTAAEAIFGTVRVSETPKYQGLMGTVSTLGWKGDTLGKKIDITAGGVTETFELDKYKNISELVDAINAKMPVEAGDLPFASLVSGRLVLQSSKGPVSVADNTSGGAPTGGTAQLFGEPYAGGINSSSSSLTIKLGDAQSIKIYINDGDDLTAIADRINAIEGIYARTSADKDQLVIVAQRTGKSPSDPLAVDEAEEKTHYPSFIVWGEGMGMSLFDFSYSVDPDTGIETGAVGSKEKTRPVDHSHIDLFDYLGMETALKSVEFKQGETLKVGTLRDPSQPYDPVGNPYEGEPLHWRIMSGKNVTEIKLNPGEYTMEQLADRLKNAGVGWLEVTVDAFRQPNVPSTDDTEVGLGTSANREEATSRLVIRSTDGSPVVFMDMNDQRYAEQMGLSTAVRTDGSMGMDEIVFPTAPCLDDNLAAMMRIQMTCGKSYDIRLTRKDIVDKTTGLVDRVKVMEQIAKQVNAQAGEEILKVVVPVDSNGKKLPGSASLVAMTGEPFSIVDLPVTDPLWQDYTAGLAAQMGIHSGVTSVPAMRDDTKITAGQTGTIRFESMGHSVEIDVAAGDTVKTIMDRLREQAGDWLYVSYFDATMGNKGGQEGDVPIISIAAKDGSAVNIIDVKGTVAQEQLLLNTSVQGSVPLIDAAGNPVSWQTTEGSRPPQTFSITVNGYTHTIDLTAMRNVNGNVDGAGNPVMDAVDLVATINSRMQDYDVRAELNEDGYLVLWSPRGYMIEVSSDAGIAVDSSGTGTYPSEFETADGVYKGPVVSGLRETDSSGVGAPTPPGVSGETYLDTDTGDIYTSDGATWTQTGALAEGEACGVKDTDGVFYCATTGTPLTDVIGAGDTAVLDKNGVAVFDGGEWTVYGAYGFMGTASTTTPYRGGYGLDPSGTTPRTAPGNYTQNVTVRSGSNQMQQNFFGVLDDISAAVRAENRDGLSDKLLPLIDNFMDNLLKVLSTDGALQGRYTGNIQRMKLNNISMTEVHDSLVKVDLAEVSTELLLAQALYQASLGVIAQIVQPTLLNFLN